MKRSTVRNYLLMVNMSYARGWEESLRLFEEFEKDFGKRKRSRLQMN
jgi:hypothetical protein